jgi:hypothetical protein
MPGNGDSQRQGVPINATTILAVMTLLGGILMVTHKLSSDRPVVPAGKHNAEISEQRIDSRLWEDPFGATPALTGATDLDPAVLGTPTYAIVDKTEALQVLVVMNPGGPAGDDRENRIRSRFAVVSALAESGYAPENPMHIGLATMEWPTTRQLTEYETRWQTNLETALHYGNKLFYAFEFYRREVFVSHSSTTNSQPVLVLWLDEDAFDDYPRTRLGLFLDKLGIETNWFKNSGKRMSLIGPRSSSTLQAIFPNEFSSNNVPNDKTSYADLVTNVGLFLATPRAMDEVLVDAHAEAYGHGRPVLLSRLSPLFKEPRNFAATDDDLAREALRELKERGIDLTLTNKHHLVLIACWDQFFGRMLSAAYAAELAVIQAGHGVDYTFLRKHQSDQNLKPGNLHAFFYLSGLDGQQLAHSPAKQSRSPEDTAPVATDSNQHADQNRWTPDVNRAEGTTQLDYLGRLADRISQLDHQLMNEKSGSVSAIGIGGGDVYDTLLILQALRPRFPNAVFFTTDLDARFWDPKESPWSRNLVVISGYGLELHRGLQGHTPPFRDSTQTAQYAAVLAALGNTNLQGLTNIPVRRFEIGRNGPVDMSTIPDLYQPRLHPEGRHPVQLWDWLINARHFWPLLFILLGILALATRLSWYFRKFTTDRYQFLAEPLWLKEEDLGGLDGLREIAAGLTDDFCKGKPQAGKLQEIIKNILGRTQSPGTPERLTFLLPEVLNEWNGRLASGDWSNGETSKPSPASASGAETSLYGQPHLIHNHKQLDCLVANRKEANQMINDLLISHDSGQARVPQDDDRFDFRWAAKAAQSVSWELFALGSLHAILVPVFSILAILLGLFTLQATLADPAGGFFSGTSTWPTTWICLLSGVLSLFFITESYFQLRRSVLETTRGCRLAHPETGVCSPAYTRENGSHIVRNAWWAIRRLIHSVSLPATSDPIAFVHANRSWADYQDKGRGWYRSGRAVFLAVAFFSMMYGIYYLVFGHFYQPFLRKPAANWYVGIMWGAYFFFLFLSFWTIDAACLCRWFILRISQGPTLYPMATREHFSQQRGQVPHFVLGEWIDVKIIAMITERVSLLIYFPAVAFFLLILAHQTIFYNWAWPPSYYALTACNLAVSAASIVILQRAARQARDQSARTLEEKINQLKAGAAVSEEQKKLHTIDETERMLQEIRGLHQGAFAAFWGNPVVGALLLPSGGTAIIEVLRLLSR